MAFFLLLYVVAVMIWVFWTGVLLFHYFKYKFPDKDSKIALGLFLGAGAVIILISVIGLSRGDWLTIPKFLGGR